MSATRAWALPLLCAAAAAAGDPPPTMVCTPQPVACEPKTLDRLDPQLQRLLVERQLESQPPYWSTVYFYLPPLEERELLELQIRYLEELLARERAKAKQQAEH